MKTTAIILGAFACLAFMQTANAEVEEFNLNVWFRVSKCTKASGSSSSDCKNITSGHSANVALKLNQCDKDADTKITTCYGQWSNSYMIEGHDFMGTVYVSKKTDADNKASYTIFSFVERKNTPDSGTTHMLRLAKNTVTDTSILFGNSVTSESDQNVNYTGLLSVGPQNQNGLSNDSDAHSVIRARLGASR